MSLQCYKCKMTLNLSANDNISRSEDCDHCHTDLRVCYMCQFFDKNAYNECREPNAPRILEKDKGNFCDYFRLGPNSNSADSGKEDLLAKANSLFK